MRAYGEETGVSPAGFRSVLRLRAFLVVYLAEAQSIAGDQLARVALSVLVYDQTGSAAATAAVYAATFLPAILGGFTLGRLGDRFPRRWVMVGCDLVRASCFAVMAVPAMPFGVVVAVLVLAVFLGPAFTAAEVSYLAARLGGERFRAASALRLMTSQAAQVAGFALGGLLVAALHPRGALLVDAATFLLSAALVAVLLPDAGKPGAHDGEGSAARGDTGMHQAAFAGLWTDRRLRALVALTAIVGFFVVPEALAVPFGTSVGASTSQIGLLLAAGALGGAAGAALLVRAVAPQRRAAVANWMAVGCGLPLLVSGLAPHWAVALVCWLVSGVLAAYIVELMAIIVQAIPDGQRAHLVGVVGALLLAAQGVGFVLFGALTEAISPAHSIALAGMIGSLLALVLALGPLRQAGEYPAAHRADPSWTGLARTSGIEVSAPRRAGPASKLAAHDRPRVKDG